jgi:lysophospholipase L1-like esterase
MDRRRVNCMGKGILLIGAVLLSACVSQGHEHRGHAPYWTQSFELSPTDAKPTEELLKSYPGLANLPTLKGTVRYRFALSIGGGALRVQLSNPTDTPLRIAAGSVALATGVMDARPESLRALRFAGQPTVQIPVNASVLSDPVDLKVEALSELVVSLYLPDGFLSSPLGGGRMNWTDEEAAMRASFADSRPTMGRPFVSGVLVARSRPTPVIAALGDSITDGARLKPAEPHGWADALARRLSRERGGLTVGVISAGIGGNRLLSPGWGPSALAREDRDVLAVPGAAYVIVLEGINDIGNSDGSPGRGDITPLSAEKLIAGLTQIGARARARGLKVYAGTLLPFRGAKYFSDDKEKIRLAVNAWIRTAGAFDGVIDFEHALQDPARADVMNPAYDSGDHLHPSEAGYQAMAHAIPLEWFN